MKSDQELITGDNSGGCVLWINFDERTMELRPFDWFGGRPGRRIPGLGTRKRVIRGAQEQPPSFLRGGQRGNEEARAVTFDGLGSLIGIDIFPNLTRAVKTQNFDAGFVSSLELAIYCSRSLNGLRHRGQSH
jgi:hypothetical protein